MSEGSIELGLHGSSSKAATIGLWKLTGNFYHNTAIAKLVASLQISSLLEANNASEVHTGN
jgi:hypothetical protein